MPASFAPTIHELARRPSEEGVLEGWFRQLARLPGCLALDSTADPITVTDESLGRYSFLSADPIDWFEIRSDCVDPFGSFRQVAGKMESEFQSGLPPFQGGWAGLITYDLNRSLESIAPPRHDEFPLPRLAFGKYDVVLAIDHAADRGWLISQGWPERSADDRRRRADKRIAFFLGVLDSPPDGPHSIPSSHFARPIQATVPTGSPVVHHPVPGPPGLTSSFSKDEYLAAVARCIDYIHRGDVFQVNLAQRLVCPAQGSAAALYCRLRTVNPAPFGGYFDYGGGQICSSSPERLVRLSRGEVETRPIKGTRPRTRFPEVDLNFAAELQSSEKDRAENTMIVDLMRNDLSRVCCDETVQVPQLCGLETYQSVFHLVSAIRGTLRPGLDGWDLLNAVFPGGSITGAPKVRAMEIIQELEPVARGAYCGSLGYLGLGGRADFNILIRTITVQGGWWQIPVGGGIVSQSDPEQEYEETWTKAASLLRSLDSVPIART